MMWNEQCLSHQNPHHSKKNLFHGGNNVKISRHTFDLTDEVGVVVNMSLQLYIAPIATQPLIHEDMLQITDSTPPPIITTTSARAKPLFSPLGTGRCQPEKNC